MKTKFFTIAILMISLAANSFAQSTAFASTTAVLVTPIAISKTTDMHFGTVAASSTAGTVVLNWANGVSPTGGASIPTGGITPTTAVFHVTGQGTSGFSIAIPGAPITLSNGVQTMTVSDFTCDEGASANLVAGALDIYVGATLNVGVGQASGTYTKAGSLSGLFVTVNYN
ncbi:MAG TPA: DUF4402 domain-containing protein [Ferruginibacter sp.]|nr:DUF4402 domain-containing protein [Ferruginibacter sp.]